MVKAVKLRIKEMASEKEETTENFTEFFYIVYDNANIIQDFKNRYTIWFNVFSTKWKLFESTKSQALMHLKLSYISRILITAFFSICILENYAKLDKAYAILGLWFYFTVIAMNFVSNILMCRSSQNKYISEVHQYFESVSAISQILKIRLGILRRRCNWDVKLSSALDTESMCTKKNTSFASLFFSAFSLYNIYGTAVGIVTFLLCQYLQLEVFAFLEIFSICVLFVIAIAKDIEIFRVFGKLKESSKFMQNATIDFLIWLENNCEIYKILQQYEASNSVTDLFPLRTLKICRKPIYLNFAVSTIACETLAGLNVSRKDFKHALVFLAYQNYSVLDKLTVRTVSSQQSSEENTVKKLCQESHSHVLSRDLDNLKELPECMTIHKSGTQQHAAKLMTPENISRTHFKNESYKIASKHRNKKGSSIPRYTGKGSRFSFSESKTDATLKKKSQARNFDENLPLRYELRKNEFEEVTGSSIGKSDVAEMDEETIREDNLVAENCEMTQASPCSQSCVNKILLRKSCSDDLNLNSSHPVIFEEELRQHNIDIDESIRGEMTKETELYTNTNERFESESKYISSGVHEQKIKNNIANESSKTLIIISHSACSCENNGSNMTIESTDIPEPFANDSEKHSASNLHEQITHVTISNDEPDNVEKDLIFDEKRNKQVIVTDKNFIKDDACHYESSGSYTLKEPENELNVIKHSDSYELITNETQSDAECGIEDDDKICDECSKKSSEVTDISVSNNKIKETETNTNKNEAFGNEFNEIRSDLQKQKSNDTKLIDEYEIMGKNLVLDNTSNNMNADTDKNIIYHDTCNHENVCSYLIKDNEAIFKNSGMSDDISNETCSLFIQAESTIEAEGDDKPNIDKNITTDDVSHQSVESVKSSFSFIDDFQDANDRINSSSTIKDDKKDVSDSLANKIKICPNTSETSENFKVKNEKLGLNQKLTQETQTNIEIAVSSKSIIRNGHNINQNEEIYVSPDFKVVPGNQNEFKKEEERQKMEQNISCFRLDARNQQDVNTEFLPITKNGEIHKNYDENLLKLKKHDLHFESAGSASGGDLTTSVPYENVINDSFVSFTDINKENLIPENENEEENENIKTDEKGVSLGKVIYPRKNSRSKSSRKNSEKNSHNKLKNKKAVKRFSNKFSIDAMDKGIKEAVLTESSYVATDEFMPCDFKSSSLAEEIDKTEIGIRKRNSGRIKDINVTNNTATDERSLQQVSNADTFTESNNDTIRSMSSEMQENFDNANQESENKPKDSIQCDNFYTDDKKFATETNYFECHLPLSQEGKAAVNVAENSCVFIHPENLFPEIVLESKDDAEKMERSFYGTNSEVEFACNDDMSMFETFSFADELLRDNDKNVASLENTVKDINVISNIETDERSSQQISNADTFSESNNDNIRNMTSEMYQNFSSANHESENKPKDSKPSENFYTDDKKFTKETNYFESHLLLSQEDKSAVNVTENTRVFKRENLTPEIVLESKDDAKQMERSFYGTNSEIEFTYNDDMMSSFETFSLADKLLGDINKNAASLDDTIKDINITNNIETNERSSQQISNADTFSESNNDTIRNMTSEMYQNFSSANHESENQPKYSKPFENFYTDDKKFTKETNYFESHLPLSQEKKSAVNVAENTRVFKQRENMTPEIVLESKDDAKQMERSFYGTNSEIEFTCNDDIMPRFQTLYLADKLLGDINKNAASLDDTVYAENDIRKESDSVMLHSTKSEILTESHKTPLTEGMSTDNTQSNIPLMEKPGRIIIKGRRINKNLKNKKHFNCVSQETSAGNYCNPKINAQAENNHNSIVDKVSLDERKVQLAEQSLLKTGDTETEISFSSKNLCEEPTKENQRSRFPVSNYGEIQNNSNDSENETATISYPATCKEKERPEKSTTQSETKHDQMDQGKKSSKILTSGVNSDANISKCNEVAHTRITLIRLWKDENNVRFAIFPKYRSSVKREIVHLEKKLRKNGKMDVHKLSAVHIKENEYIFQTVDDDKHYFDSSLEVTSRYPGAESAENAEKIQNWLQTMPTTNTDGNSKLSENSYVLLEESTEESNFLNKECSVNSNANFKEVDSGSEKSFNKYQDVSHISNHSFSNRSEISEEVLNNSKTPLTGSSEVSNFRFHQSTSASDTNSYISDESREISDRLQSSACFSTNHIPSECVEVDEDKNTSLDLKSDRIIDASSSETSKTVGGIKWVSEVMSTEKVNKISDNQPVSSNNTSKSSTSKNSSYMRKFLNSNETLMKEMNEKLKKGHKSEPILIESQAFSNAKNMSSKSKYVDLMTSDAQMTSAEDFATSSDNYDGNQNYFQELNQTDPLKYYLKYKNIDLHVLDTSRSITIRLIDEKDDNSSTLTPKWRNFVTSPLSSSNSSIYELLLPSTMSSNSSGETIKDDINISEGKLKMVVGKSNSEDSPIAFEAHESLTNIETSSENIRGEIKDIKNDNTTSISALENRECVDKISQYENKDQLPISEFDKSENFVDKHTTSKFETNESAANDNHVLEGNETEMENSSFNRGDNYFGENSKENKIFVAGTNDACDTKIEQFQISENCSIGVESAVIGEDASSEDFHFETKGVKLTCKPSIESDSLEVKFRQLPDKTSLTFKSGYKKLYLKMSP